MKRNKFLILNYFFIGCLLILSINDHFLKQEFSNWITGKLSDAVGIIILPLLLSYIFPKVKANSIWISAVIFAFWKSPFSDKFIEFYNQISFIKITRVVDYTDLLVFILLPIPYYLLKNIHEIKRFHIQNIHPALLLFPTGFVLMATSPPPSFQYILSKQNLHCMKCHITVSLSQNEIVEALKKDGIVFDTIFPMTEKVYERHPYFRENDIHFYQIKEMIIDTDTLRKVEFAMRSIGKEKTKLYFNGMYVNEDISTLKLIRKARKKYRKIIFKEVKNSLKGNK